MPIYEYACNNCGLRKEYLQKASDEVISQCPECGSPKYSKCLSAPVVKQNSQSNVALPPCQVTGRCNGCMH